VLGAVRSGPLSGAPACDRECQSLCLSGKALFPLGEEWLCSVYHSLLQGNAGEAIAAKNCDIRGKLRGRDTYVPALGGQWSAVMPLSASRWIVVVCVG